MKTSRKWKMQFNKSNFSINYVHDLNIELIKIY